MKHFYVLASKVRGGDCWRPTGLFISKKFLFCLCILGNAQAMAADEGVGAFNVISLGAELSPLLSFARQHNPDYAASLKQADEAMARAEVAGAFPDPYLRVEWMNITRDGSQNPTLSPSRVERTRYGLFQTLPWWGKRDLRQEVASNEAEGARQLGRGVWLDIATRIKILFAELYADHHSIAWTSQTLEWVTQSSQVVKSRYTVGLASQQDMVRAQVEQTTLKNQLFRLKRERDTKVAQMNALLARPSSQPLARPSSLPMTPSLSSLEKLMADLEDNSPELRAELAKARAEEQNQKLVDKDRYPDVTLGVLPIQMDRGIRQWDVMLEVTIPLQQGVRRGLEKAAVLRTQLARARQEAARNRLRAKLSASVEAIAASRQSAQFLRDSLLPQAELSVQTAMAGYQTGKVDFAAVLEAQRNLLLARHELVQEEAEQAVQRAEIEQLIGGEL